MAKLSKGKYYKAEQTVFGRLEPDQYQVVKDLLEDSGKVTGYLTGYSIYNKLGLTTQISNIIQIGKNDVRPQFMRSRSAFRQFIHINKDQYSDALLTLFAETKVDYHDLVLSVSEIKGDTDLKKIDNLYQSCFGQSSVPSDTQKKWWNAYPKGIIGLYYSKNLIGGLSYWPISLNTFEKLKLGKLREREIGSSGFDTTNPHHFYISEIAIKEEFRQKHYSNLLLIFFYLYRTVFSE